MKKLLFFGFTVLASVSADAQTLNPGKIHAEDMNPGLRAQDMRKVIVNAKRRGQETGGGNYNYLQAYGDELMLGDPKTYVRWMMPDTNAAIVYSGGEKQHVSMCVVGSVFDPKDTTFASAGLPVLTKFNPYTVDTLRWIQYYIRNVDSIDVAGTKTNVVDTVYLQYFDISGIDFRGFTFQNKNNRNASPKVATYVPKSLLNTAAMKTDTFLLDKTWADSFSVEGGNLYGRFNGTTPKIVSQSSNGATFTNNIMAFAVTFKPMIKAKLGDTIINWAKTGYAPTVNAFGVRMGYFTNTMHEIISPYRYNNSFWTPFDLAGGQTINGWKSYYPTSAYSTTSFWAYNVDITTENLSTKEMNKGISGTKVYPNPTSGSSDAVAVFNLNKASSVSAQIVDLNGRVVRSINARQFNAGSNQLGLSTKDLSAGIYTVVLQSAAGTESSKLVVQ